MIIPPLCDLSASLSLALEHSDGLFMVQLKHLRDVLRMVVVKKETTHRRSLTVDRQVKVRMELAD